MCTFAYTSWVMVQSYSVTTIYLLIVATTGLMRHSVMDATSASEATGSLWSNLSSFEVFPLSQIDDHADQRGCSKENSWWWPPLLPAAPTPTPPTIPLICTLNMWTPPFFYSCLSCRIYICHCRAKVVSRFICAEFIGSSLLSCFGLCVFGEMQRVKCKPWGHVWVTD